MPFWRRSFRRTFRRRHPRIALWGKWLIGTALVVALMGWFGWL